MIREKWKCKLCAECWWWAVSTECARLKVDSISIAMSHFQEYKISISYRNLPAIQNSTRVFKNGSTLRKYFPKDSNMFYSRLQTKVQLNWTRCGIQMIQGSLPMIYCYRILFPWKYLYLVKFTRRSQVTAILAALSFGRAAQLTNSEHIKMISKIVKFTNILQCESRANYSH